MDLTNLTVSYTLPLNNVNLLILFIMVFLICISVNDLHVIIHLSTQSAIIMCHALPFMYHSVFSVHHNYSFY